MRCRLNPAYGPLNDTRHRTLFMAPAWGFTQTAPNQYLRSDLSANDSPIQLFLRRYSGDPFHPGVPLSNSPLQTLVQTTGIMRFITYLAAANLGTRSVVTLAECHWTLTWDGQYVNDTDTWTPGTEFLFYEERDMAFSYHDVHVPPTPPFSLLLYYCGRFQEVEHAGTWHPYALPDWTNLVTPTLELWGR
jgi:hypothetical protein